MSNNVTIDQAPASFLAEEVKAVKRPIVRRFDSRGQRFYYVLDEKNEPILVPSVTTILKATTPMAPGLLDWYANLGIDEAKRIMNEKAAYGTFLHILCGLFLESGVLDLSMIDSITTHYVAEHSIAFNTSWWPDELRKDLLSFAAFCNEKEVKPIAIEIPLLSPTLGYAGTIDLVCEMTFNRKTVRAIIDIKSGKKGFYEDHEIQLEAYRQLWNEAYPTMPALMVFNWAPKDWRDKPTYDLKNQSESSAAAKWPLLVQIYATAEREGPKPIKQCFGTIVLGREVAENYAVIEAADYIRQYHTALDEQKLEEAIDVEAF